MTLQQEFSSWLSPETKHTDSVPEVGSKAPSSDRLSIPSADGHPTVVTFLRHCGCPFAEKTFKSIRATAGQNPSIRFVAVSHSDQESTDRWLAAVGGAGAVDVLVDPDRDLFALWGLGVSSFWHVMSPSSMWSVYKLGSDEGIWNRPTESGSRWQTAGTFAVDGDGRVKWGGPAARADDVPDFNEAVEALEKAGAPRANS